MELSMDLFHLSLSLSLLFLLLTYSSKKFLFQILWRDRNDFSSRYVRGKRDEEREEKGKRERGEENAPIETARSFPCFQLSIGEKEEEEEDECSSERGWKRDAPTFRVNL